MLIALGVWKSLNYVKFKPDTVQVFRLNINFLSNIPRTSSLNSSFPEQGFNVASEEQKGLGDSIVSRMNYGNSKERNKALHWRRDGRFVMWEEEVMLNTVGDNSSFVLMTHTHTLARQRDRTLSQDFHYYLHAPWVMLPGRRCQNVRTVQAENKNSAMKHSLLFSQLQYIYIFSVSRTLWNDCKDRVSLGRITFALLGTGLAVSDI